MSAAARPRPLWVVLALALTALLITAVLLELLLVVLDAGKTNRYVDPYLGIEESAPLFQRVEHRGKTWFQTAPVHRERFREQIFPARKPSDEFRIFALGGSTTHGLSENPEEAWPFQLELLLNRDSEETNYQVINVAAPDMAAYRLARLLSSLVSYDPDLFLIYTGHAEWLEPRTYGKRIHESTPMRKWRRRLARIRLVNVLGQGPGKPKHYLGADIPTRSWNDHEVPVDFRDAALTHFHFSVRLMIDIAADHKIAIAFIDPVGNMIEAPPNLSRHAGGVDAAAIDEALEEARNLLSQRRPEEALALLDPALARDPGYAETYFLMGGTYFLMKNATAAEACFQEALRLDALPVRATREINQILAEQTSETGAQLIPFRAALYRRALLEYGFALPGRRYFLDETQLKPEIQRMLAEHVAEVLKARGLVGE
ncbi:MAG: tetratricopeptide repeat protein [Acidobacteriota bacterium]|nr:tetratricopeptide repeat protein [Acidobacteriota bacterium]